MGRNSLVGEPDLDCFLAVMDFNKVGHCLGNRHVGVLCAVFHYSSSTSQTATICNCMDWAEAGTPYPRRLPLEDAVFVMQWHCPGRVWRASLRIAQRFWHTDSDDRLISMPARTSQIAQIGKRKIELSNRSEEH